MMTAHAKKETERDVKIQFTLNPKIMRSVALGRCCLVLLLDSNHSVLYLLSSHYASLGFCACSMAANVDKIAIILLFSRYFSNNNSKYTNCIQYC